MLHCEVMKKSPGREQAALCLGLARPQGCGGPAPVPPQLLPAMGLLQWRPVTQKWTRSTSWLATSRWQAVHVMGRERCFSPRQGRHRRWPQGSWYTGSFLK